jgi:quinol monooxygenase YgiN
VTTGFGRDTAIDAHNQSPHFTAIVPRFADLLAEPMEVNLYTIIE